MQSTEQKIERAALAGLAAASMDERERSTDISLAELAALVETAGGQPVVTLLQNKPTPDPRTFLGEGKVAEVQLYCENTGATMVIFDNDLSPSQMRVLTELLGVQVLDRCGLILDIFAQRAKTKEGRLQVELAQYQYLLPRLVGMWTHLERQAGTSGKGPIGSKGPGETQLETDRRHIHRKIDKLKAELEEKGYHFTYDDALVDYLVKKSYSAAYGARNLRRCIQKDVEDPMAARIIESYETPITQIKATAEDGAVELYTL